MPLLKETRETLRLYFAFSAALSIPANGGKIHHGSGAPPASAQWFVNMTFAVLFLYIAVRFETFISKPALLKGALFLGMAWTSICFASSLRNGVTVSSVADLVLGLLVSVYLLTNVARLSAETGRKVG